MKERQKNHGAIKLRKAVLAAIFKHQEKCKNGASLVDVVEELHGCYDEEEINKELEYLQESYVVKCTILHHYIC